VILPVAAATLAICIGFGAGYTYRDSQTSSDKPMRLLVAVQGACLGALAGFALLAAGAVLVALV
jgi:hypothetical protein